jgi:hypothetical protein
LNVDEFDDPNVFLTWRWDAESIEKGCLARFLLFNSKITECF